MSEHDLQNRIRLELSKYGFFFRGNVGMGWQGVPVKRTNDMLTLRHPHPISSGLPKGFPDLFGWKPVVITPDMVGQTIAVFTGIEVKTPKGRVSPEQQRFIDVLNQHGGKGIVARSVDDLVKLDE